MLRAKTIARDLTQGLIGNHVNNTLYICTCGVLNNSVGNVNVYPVLYLSIGKQQGVLDES